MKKQENALRLIKNGCKLHQVEMACAFKQIRPKYEVIDVIFEPYRSSSNADIKDAKQLASLYDVRLKKQWFDGDRERFLQLIRDDSKKVNGLVGSTGKNGIFSSIISFFKHIATVIISAVSSLGSDVLPKITKSLQTVFGGLVLKNLPTAFSNFLTESLGGIARAFVQASEKFINATKRAIEKAISIVVEFLNTFAGDTMQTMRKIWFDAIRPLVQQFFGSGDTFAPSPSSAIGFLQNLRGSAPKTVDTPKIKDRLQTVEEIFGKALMRREAVLMKSSLGFFQVASAIEYLRKNHVSGFGDVKGITPVRAIVSNLYHEAATISALQFLGPRVKELKQTQQSVQERSTEILRVAAETRRKENLDIPLLELLGYLDNENLSSIQRLEYLPDNQSDLTSEFLHVKEQSGIFAAILMYEESAGFSEPTLCCVTSSANKANKSQFKSFFNHFKTQNMTFSVSDRLAATEKRILDVLALLPNLRQKPKVYEKLFAYLNPGLSVAKYEQELLLSTITAADIENVL